MRAPWNRRVLSEAALVVSALVVAPSAAAQAAQGLQLASRAELVARKDSLERVLAAGALRGKSREQAAGEVAALQRRLEEGDFQVGDRFLVTILHDNAVSDSVLVREERAVSIASLPDASVQGVLRSELTDHLSAHVAKYLKSATVRTQLLTRVSVIGAVARPGYYYVAPNRPVSELLMAVGGAAPTAKLAGAEVRRNGRVVLPSKAVRRALEAGLTLEQLDIRSGDEMLVPTPRRLNWGLALQVAFLASSLFFAYLQFLQWYYRDDA
jgi:protein involved in polysaccharide export with SLBB domain